MPHGLPGKAGRAHTKKQQMRAAAGHGMASAIGGWPYASIKAAWSQNCSCRRVEMKVGQPVEMAPSHIDDMQPAQGSVSTHFFLGSSTRGETLGFAGLTGGDPDAETVEAD